MSIVHASSTVANAARLPPVIETVTLSGSTGTPNTSTDFAISTNNAEVRWYFNSDGTIDRLKLQLPDSFDLFPGVQWCNQTPVGSYWLRFTHNAGDVNNVGNTSGSWLIMTTALSQGWNESTNGFAETAGSSKVEIATDSGGSNIVATGYYGGTATVEI